MGMLCDLGPVTAPLCSVSSSIQQDPMNLRCVLHGMVVRVKPDDGLEKVLLTV